jgi:glutathione S-transferase
MERRSVPAKEAFARRACVARDGPRHHGLLRGPHSRRGIPSHLRPERYGSKGKDIEAIKAEGRAIVASALLAIDSELKGKDYAAGGFSIADAALFYNEFWADKIGMELPPSCLAHYQLMRSRPAVRQVLAEEGYR